MPTPTSLHRSEGLPDELREVGHLVDELTERLRQGLRKRLAEHARHGHSLQEIGSVEQIAERMLEAVPQPSRWNDLLGPFYDTRQVTRLLGGASRQAIADRRKRGTLLGLKTSDGVVAYPAFQFDRQNRVLSGLAEVLRCFRDSSADEWSVAGWLVSPLRSLKGQSAVDWLRDGKDPRRVLLLARDAARRFS